MSQPDTDKARVADRRSEETRSFVRQVRAATRRKYTPEEKIRIVLEGFRREVTVNDLCRREGIKPRSYYAWTKEFMESSKFVGVKVLVHYYVPVVFYFIARRYTVGSTGNVMNITKLVWLLTALFIIDFLIELYIVNSRGSALSIPWVSNELSKLSGASAQSLANYYLENIPTISIGGKKPGFVAAALLVLMLPYLLADRGKDRKRWGIISWQFNTVLSVLLVAALSYAVFRLHNKTALLAMAVVLAIEVFSLRSIRKMALLAVLLLVGLTFSYSTINNMVRVQFLEPYINPNVPSDTTPFAYLMSPQLVVAGFRDADLHSLFFGGYQVGDSSLFLKPGLSQGAAPAEFGVGELRATGLVIYFGIGWALIIIAGVVVMFGYSAALTRIPHFKFFGLALLGMVIVYASDLHYPSAISHGPIELFVIMAGALSSLHEIARAPEAAVDESDSSFVQTPYDSGPQTVGA